MTAKKKSREKKKSFKQLLAYAFTLAAVSGWLSVGLVFSSPSESGNAFIFGLSAARLGLLAFVASVAMVISWLTWSSKGRTEGQKRVSKIIEEISSDFRKFWIASLLLGIEMLASWGLIFLPSDRAAKLFGSLALYLPRLRPVLGYAHLLGAILLLLLIISRFGWHGKAIETWKKISSLALGVYGLFLLLWILVAVSGLGLGFDISQWNAPGAPIMMSQVFIALGISLGLVLLLKDKPLSQWQKWVIFLLIWGIAAGIWLSISASSTYYSSVPIAPNDQAFPLSDAFNHDVIANNVLIGEGYRFGDLRAIRKPLYVSFLAVLHVIAGHDYELLVNLQVVVLALFPALLYLLGRQLHSRLAGFLMAGLVIFREANAIRLGGVINISHAKLLMADFPAALGLAVLCLASIYWLKTKKENAHMALLVGGILGSLLLLRSQQITVVAVFMLAIFLIFKSKDWRSGQIFLVGITLAVGISIALGPWLIRNRNLTGEWIFEQSTAASYLAQRYSDDPQSVETDFLPGESEGQYYARHMDAVKQYVLEEPVKVAGFAVDNYMRNVFLTVMELPLSFQLRDLESHVRQQGIWPSWNGQLSLEGGLLMAINLLLIAFGIALAWRKLGWIGLIPLFVSLSFAINLALARVSGWRYNQPVDWISILYYALGISQVVFWAFAAIGEKGRVVESEQNDSARADSASGLSFSWQKITLVSVMLIGVGMGPIMVEAFSERRYAKVDEVALLQDLEVMEPNTKQIVEKWLEDGLVRMSPGRALYPRLMAAHAGEREREFALIRQMDFARLTFFVIGPNPTSVILPVERAGAEIQSGMDVIVLMCKGKSILAAGVLILDQAGKVESIILSNEEMVCEQDVNGTADIMLNPNAILQ